MREARLDVVLKAFPAGLPVPHACWLLGRVANAIAAQPRSVTPTHIRIRSDGGVRVASGLDPAPFHYRAPEELAGKGANVRSAVFTLGVVLVETITGRPPFERESDFETRIAVQEDSVASLVGRVAQATTQLDRMVAKALAKHPADRFGSTVELGEELDRFLEDNLLEIGPDDLREALGPLLAKAPRVERAPRAPARDPRVASDHPPVPRADARPEVKLKTPLPQPSTHDFANAELDLQPERRRISAPNKPRFDQDLVRVGDALDASAGAGVTEASVTGVRSSGPGLPRPTAAASPRSASPRAVKRPDARMLLEIDEEALDEERSRAGTMATSEPAGPPPVNWTLRIGLILLALLGLAVAYQFAVRPLLLD